MVCSWWWQSSAAEQMVGAAEQMAGAAAQMAGADTAQKQYPNRPDHDNSRLTRESQNACRFTTLC